MKSTKHISSVLGLFAVMSYITSVEAQTYSFMKPVTVVQVTAKDMETAIAQLNLTPSMLNETIIIDPNNQTMREMGTLTLASGATEGTASETRQVPGTFPNPPVTVPGTLTVDMSFSSATLSFDSGVRPLQFVRPNTYSFNGSISINLPVNFSYSLSTGGQTYTGSALANIGFTFDGGSVLDTSGYPDAISTTPENVSLFIIPTTVSDFTAPNGFRTEVTLAPEPSALALGVLGLLCFIWAAKIKKPSFRKSSF